MSHFNVIYPLCYLNRYTVNKNFTIKYTIYNISVAECAFACSLVPNGSPQWMDPHVDLAKILRRMPFVT